MDNICMFRLYSRRKVPLSLCNVLENCDPSLRTLHTNTRIRIAQDAPSFYQPLPLLGVLKNLQRSVKPGFFACARPSTPLIHPNRRKTTMGFKSNHGAANGRYIFFLLQE